MIHSKVDKESKTKDIEHETAKEQDESQALTVKKEDLEDEQKKATIEYVFLFSSESVYDGHQDKPCDQVSDPVLDACLTVDLKSKVPYKIATKDNMVMVM
eukprot:7170405-Heterocapsa_arctica.AAC.1